MDFVEVIQQCEDTAVSAALLGSLRTLFEHDRKLLDLSVKEEAIAFHLARYLQPYFPELNVDFEYDRMGDAPKTVTYDERPQRVYPDIIVHVRYTTTNVLAIELKRIRTVRRRIEISANWLRTAASSAIGTRCFCGSGRVRPRARLSSANGLRDRASGERRKKEERRLCRLAFVRSTI